MGLILQCYFVLQLFLNSHKYTAVNHRCNLWTAVVIILCDSEQLAGDLNECLAYMWAIHNQTARRVGSRGWDFQKPTLSTGHCNAATFTAWATSNLFMAKCHTCYCGLVHGPTCLLASRSRIFEKLISSQLVKRLMGSTWTSNDMIYIC